jgi:hypothetical protein
VSEGAATEYVPNAPLAHEGETHSIDERDRPGPGVNQVLTCLPMKVDPHHLDVDSRKDVPGESLHGGHALTTLEQADRLDLHVRMGHQWLGPRDRDERLSRRCVLICVCRQQGVEHRCIDERGHAW